MFKSLRWRIQIWYAMLLAVVLGGYSSFIYVRLRHVEFQRLDAEIESAANSLVSVLRGIPRHELERNLAPDRPPENMPWPPRRRGGDPQGRDPFGGDPFGGDPFMEPPAGRGPPGAGGPFRPGPPQDNARRWSDALRLPPSFTDRYESVPHFFMVWQEKDIFAKSNSAPDINQITIPPEADSRRPYFYSDRELRYVVQRGPANTYVAVARSMSPERATLQRWWQWLLGGSSSLFVITMLGGMWLSRRALKPIAAMSSTAAKISEQNLSLRIDTTKTDTELMQLAETLNETFTRLEQAFTRQASFTADASHELRTPLSILLAQLEVLEKQVPANAQNGIKICERAARRMKSLVEQLLTLARADAYKLPLEPIDFDLSAVVEECVDLLSHLPSSQRCR